ncbi:MAG: (2Fe-2S)-binding protein, partial [Candidatus Cloacimonas sp.]|nr:(2Fe-2S)-binding protein [Candidatus Cloacimonadota bacterium]
FACDTLLIAVGLESLNEFTQEAEVAGIPVYAAGDSDEIAEASSAMFNGKITGLKIAKDLGAEIDDIPQEWYQKAEVLKKHPGEVHQQKFSDVEEGVMPVIHCLQEIPCNPCSTVCPLQSIQLKDDPLMGLPQFVNKCIGCNKCLLICPGLAITLVDYRKDKENPTVTLPYEIGNYPVKKGDKVKCVNIDGDFLAELEVIDVVANASVKTELVKVLAPREIAKRVVSFRVQDESITQPLAEPIITEFASDDSLVCLCERVTVGEVRALIREGVTDINQIKAITRLGMGPCGSKTCDTLLKQVFREEGFGIQDVVENTKRPVFVEVPLKYFVNADEGE